MNVSAYAYKPVLGAVVALAITGAAAPSFAARLAQADNGATAVMATEQPAAPGTGANPGDSLRAEMQASPQSFAMLAKSFTMLRNLLATHGTSGSDTVKAANMQPYGRAGGNPTLVQLQATPEPLPWHG